MAVAENNTPIGWDTQTIDDPGKPEYTLLEPGEYEFAVTGMKRGHFNGSDNMCACPKAIISIEISDESGTAVIYHNLFLNKKCVGFLAAFFASVGLHKHGTPLQLAWNRIVGCRGRCIIDHRTGKNKLKYNEITKFLDPPEGATAPQPASTPTDTGGEIPF